MGAAASVQEPGVLALKDRQAVLGGRVPSLSAVADLIRDGRVRRVLVAAGAGISVAAGIPDFRTPGTGLYSNLEKYGLPTPESVFTLEYFKERPEPFCELAQELLPGLYEPTLSHRFLRLLEVKGLLQRVFTQNIDGLERLAGISPELLVEAHGSFADAHCVECGQQHRITDWRDEVVQGRVPRCRTSQPVPRPQPPPLEADLESLRQQLLNLAEEKAEAWKRTDFNAITSIGVKEVNTKSKLEEGERQLAEAPAQQAAWEAGPKTYICEGLVKPDIVFFGEGLPARFSYLASRDGRIADLLIVMGTSLQVMPFAGVLGKVGPLCPRLLINREAAGLHSQPDPPMLFGNIGFRFDQPDNYRDIHVAADCDAGIKQLCDMLGWTDELQALAAAPASSSNCFDVVASRQHMQEPFEESMAAALAKDLFQAIAVSGGQPADADALRHDTLTTAGVKLRPLETEMLLVGCDGESPTEGHVPDLAKSDFLAAARKAFLALGEQVFCAMALRQTCCLSGCVPQGQKLKDHIIECCSAVRSQDGTLDEAALAQVLQNISKQNWDKDRVQRLLGAIGATCPDRVNLTELLTWMYADRGRSEGERLTSRPPSSEVTPQPASLPRRSVAGSAARARSSSRSAPAAKAKRRPSPSPTRR